MTTKAQDLQRLWMVIGIAAVVIVGLLLYIQNLNQQLKTSGPATTSRPTAYATCYDKCMIPVFAKYKECLADGGGITDCNTERLTQETACKNGCSPSTPAPSIPRPR